MTGDLILALDAGTSVVKAAVFDARGAELTVARRRTTPLSPQPGWSEVSMDETWRMACAAIREVLADVEVGRSAVGRIAAVGITGQMVGAWLIDADGEPVRPAIQWNDNRAQPLIEAFSSRQPDFMHTIYTTSGSVMQQGCTLPVLAWLKEHEPATLERAAAVLCCKDWIAYRLTGTRQVDPTEASVMPGDMYARGYSEAMWRLFGLDAYARLFPPVQNSHAVVGSVLPGAAEATGLREGTPVIAGAGDVPASVLGLGVATPGAACTLLGTNILNCLFLAAPHPEPQYVGLHFVMPETGWLRAMVNVSGTTSLDWFVAQFCAAEVAAARSDADLYAQLEALAQQSPIGAQGLLYLPYLSLQGITAPYAEPAARAEFFGLTDEHARADLLRAVYEGLALSIRDGYAVMDMPVESIYLSGGGAKSRFWSQMIADCTGKEVIIPAGSEFGAKGAALLAMVGMNWFASVADAVAATAGSPQRFAPNAAATGRYDARYATYVTLRDALRAAWRQAARSA
jgi:sugar (pentulose or hexulose) kinase